MLLISIYMSLCAEHLLITIHAVVERTILRSMPHLQANTTNLQKKHYSTSIALVTILNKNTTDTV